MSCPSATDLSAYLDDELPAADRARLDRHLPSCPACRAQLAALGTLQQQLRALPSPTLGFDLAAQLQDRLRAAPPRRRAGLAGPLGGWRGWLPTGLASALALASGLWLGGLMLGGGAVGAPGAALPRVFDPVPPGGLCAAAELCRATKGMP